jgi:hypothetical protein
MNSFLAQAPAVGGDATSWLVVLALLTLVQLMLGAKQLFGGNKGERQIEPTSLHSITSELRAQTQTLNKLDREMGGVVTSITAFQRDLSEVKATHAKYISDAHARIGGISRDLAATAAKVEGHEKRENA